MSAFHYDSDKKLLHLDSTKEALKAAPRFEVAKWQDFNQQAEVAEVYRYYRTTPYFGEKAEVKDYSPDKLPSRSETLPTPIDQGNNASDLQLTAQIRKDVLGQSELSTAAKNVKIITANGRVTLRGTVASDSERQLIQRLAETRAPNQVDNQLEVQNATTNK
jgi:osmotically-inducible protein OsmY